MTECERIIKNGILKPEFFKPEIRNDFFVDENRKKIWAIEIDLLLKFDEVCKKLNLKYFLIGGSLLGAIRHNGFIPWDDDMDVGMPREDYDKFIKLKNEFQNPYFLQTPYTDKGFFFTALKIKNSNTAAMDRPFLFQGFNLGIFIDVLPIDNVKNIDEYKKNFEEINKLVMDNATYMRLTNPNLIERDKKRVKEYKGGNPMEKYEKIQQIARKYCHEKTKYSAILVVTTYGESRHLFNSSDFESVINWDFEGYKIPVPSGYEGILRTMYGDYMKFPPIEQRGTWHGNIIFEPDIPYKNLLEIYQNDVDIFEKAMIIEKRREEKRREEKRREEKRSSIFFFRNYFYTRYAA